MRDFAGYRFRSHPQGAILFKYWQTLIAFAMAIGLGTDPPFRIVVVVPLVLWAIFCLTAAEVRAHDHVLEYRRFLKWTQIPYEHIQQCKNSWIPGLAYFRLARFAPPWGKIYFVIARPLFTGNPKELVAFIDARIAGREFPLAPDAREAPEDKGKGARHCALAFVVGILYSFMLNYLFPNFPPQISSEGYPRLLAVIIHIWQRAATWPWGIVTAVLLVGLILRERFAKRTWILAWVLGAVLTQMAISAIR
jgi:hypothetical protein